MCRCKASKISNGARGKLILPNECLTTGGREAGPTDGTEEGEGEGCGRVGGGGGDGEGGGGGGPDGEGDATFPLVYGSIFQVRRERSVQYRAVKGNRG